MAFSSVYVPISFTLCSHDLPRPLQYDIGVISGCLIMPDFVERFGVMGPDGVYVLDAHRQSIITSLLSAG